MLVTNKIAIDASEYPSCFYQDDLYDASDPEKGLFRSEFLARVSNPQFSSSATTNSHKLGYPIYLDFSLDSSEPQEEHT